MSTSFPVSDHAKTRGVVYFARMVDKTRLHAADKLTADYIGHLGFGDNTSFDARCCRFWGLDYEQVKARTLKGGTAEEIFDDLFAGRQPLNTEQVFVWNERADGARPLVASFQPRPRKRAASSRSRRANNSAWGFGRTAGRPILITAGAGVGANGRVVSVGGRASTIPSVSTAA